MTLFSKQSWGSYLLLESLEHHIILLSLHLLLSVETSENPSIFISRAFIAHEPKHEKILMFILIICKFLKCFDFYLAENHLNPTWNVQQTFKLFCRSSLHASLILSEPHTPVCLNRGFQGITQPVSTDSQCLFCSTEVCTFSLIQLCLDVWCRQPSVIQQTLMNMSSDFSVNQNLHSLFQSELLLSFDNVSTVLYDSCF